jgi:hypothetical protein
LPEKLSTTDPDATWSAKHGFAVLAYYDHYLIDNESCIVLGVEATPARFSAETAAAKQMITAAKTRFGLQPVSLGADKGYGSAEFVDWLWSQGVAPHIPLIDRKKQTKNAFTRDDFTYLPDQNAYQCPEGKLLPYVGLNRPSQQHIYRATQAQCGPCPAKNKCTSAPLDRSELVRSRAGPRASAGRYSRIPPFATRSQQGRGPVFRTETADRAHQAEASSKSDGFRAVPACSDRTKPEENGAFLENLPAEPGSGNRLAVGRSRT